MFSQGKSHLFYPHPVHVKTALRTPNAPVTDTTPAHYTCIASHPSTDSIPQSQAESVSYTDTIVPDNADIVAYGDDGRTTSTVSRIPPRADKYPETPFESDAPVDLLSRTQRLGTFSWTDGMPYRRIHVPARLAQRLTGLVPFEMYEYFSYKSVTCRFTLNSTPYFSGLLGVTYLPGDPFSDHVFSIQSLLQLPTHIIDASVTGVSSYEFAWPLALPRTDSIDRAHGSIIIYPLTKLVNTAEPTTDPTLHIVLEANFNNPSLTIQSLAGISIQNLVDTTGVLQAQTFWNLVQGKTPNKESQEKSEKGTLTGVAESVKNVAAVVKHVPLVGTIAAGVEVVAAAAETVFSWFGLSKPPTDSLPQFVLPTVQFGENYFHGVQMSHSLSRNPLPLIASDPALVNEDMDVLDLYAMAKTESYVTTFQLSPTAAAEELLYEFPVHPNTIFGTPNPQLRSTNNVGYVASFFGLWTGAMKYRLKFASTKFQKARIAIQWAPYAGAPYSSDHRREEYTIEGTTDIEFTVPWTRPEPYRRCNVPSTNANDGSNRHNGFIRVFVSLPMVNTAPADPSPMPILLFNAGGENIQFANYTGCRYTSPLLYTSAALALSAATETVQGAFGATSGSFLSGVVDEDNIVSFREIAKDRSLYNTQLYDNGTRTLNPNSNGSTHRLFYLLRKFKYWRGSVAFSTLSTAYTGQGFFFLTRPDGPSHLTNGRDVPYVTVIRPLTQAVPYYATGATWDITTTVFPTIDIVTNGTDTVTTRNYVALQDDFVAGVMMPSPLLSTTALGIGM